MVRAAKKNKLRLYAIVSFCFLIFLAIIYTTAIQKPLKRDTMFPIKADDLLSISDF